MNGRDIDLSPKGDTTMYILTHKQSKGISSITEYEKLSILRNWHNKTLAVKLINMPRICAQQNDILSN